MRVLFPQILLAILLTHTTASGLSVVYNFRIAQITRQPIGQQTDKRPYSLSPLIFDFFQKTKNFDIRENYVGGLTTFNYNFASKYYFRADLAVAHANQKTNNFQTVDITEPDDLLFTLGRNIRAAKKSKVTISGLFGIPTHPVYTLQRVGVGPGQVGIGTQLDGLYKFNKHVDLLCGGRYNYFIPRTSYDSLGNSYKFTIGSIADILVALQSSNPLRHGIEGGYDARWGFGPRAYPTIAKIGLLNYMRHNFYLVYKYTLLTERVAHRLLLNISYGFDAKPKLYGYNAVMIWGSWGIAF